MAASFDALLQADRKKRNEELAQKLLGGGRRSITPSNGVRKPSVGGSLASRIGAPNRSFSAGPRVQTKNRGSAPAESQRASTGVFSRNTRPNRENPMVRKAQRERISESIVKMDLDSDSNNQANVLNHGEEITIRGAAGPCTVVGSNFAPGTTAADIESALAPIGGPMESCLIVSHRPTVVAEMVFLEKSSAENVIATFNNKKADGRLLRLELKVGRPSMPSTVLSHESPRIDLTRSDVRRNEPPRNEPIRNGPPRNAPSEPKAARVDLTYEENSYATQREQSDRSRRLAQPEFQDGSYGFEHKEDGMEVDKDNERPRQYGHMRGGGRPREERRLYSDDLYPRSRGRGYR